MNDATQALLQDRPLLHVKYTNRRAVPQLVDRREGRVALYVPEALDAEHGALVRLRVAFGDTAKNFYVTGRAARARRGTSLADGYFLVIQGPADLRGFQHLWSFCTGLTHEQARRFSASIPCAVRARGAEVQGRILDLSMSGAFVAVEGSPPAGAEVDLLVRSGFLRLQRRELRAQLVWQGEKEGVPGFGAEFVGATRAARELLRGSVHR